MSQRTYCGYRKFITPAKKKKTRTEQGNHKRSLKLSAVWSDIASRKVFESNDPIASPAPSLRGALIVRSSLKFPLACLALSESQTPLMMPVQCTTLKR